MDELKYTQQFIKFYGIFTLIMLIFNVTGVVQIFPEVPELSGFNLSSIISSVTYIATFIFSLLFYSIPEYTVLNYILWIFRSISILELLLYFKRVVHPTSN